MRRYLALAFCLLFLSSPARADGPADNIASQVRRIPKLGIEVPAEQRRELETELAALAKSIADLANKKDPLTRDLLPDVSVLHKAAHDGLAYQEFFSPKDVDDALMLVRLGRTRAEQLLAGRAPWTTQTGLVVRGYVSRIDGSVQPYGLVVPATYDQAHCRSQRLDVWFHGRGETLSETSFLAGRLRDPGQFTPPDTIVLHPYGRYSNAFKFAGEVDTLEALEDVRRHYRVDGDRIAVRGFSMGGAAVWHFAVHYADRWVAANPGAGFAETPEFLKFFQKESLAPAWYEQKLWRWYDATDWARNLAQCPTVAYSGEIDVQKQAADIMETALARQGMRLVHIIGPQTGHAYHPQAKAEVQERMSAIAARGRQHVPREVRLVTYTLKYNRMHWVTVDALGEHWEPASLDARLEGESRVSLATSNVTALSLSMPAGWSPLDVTRPVRLTIDGQELEAPGPWTDRSWQVSLHQASGRWQLGPDRSAGLQKKHDLQGPIDDAFMDSFLFVRPTGQARHELVGRWAAGELDRAIQHWRRHFRGEARVKDDRDVTDADIAGANLVLWGDPASNAVLARIADRLPIRWEAERIAVGSLSFPAAHHAAILVYPNPLNPARYVVLNSSFTFRDYAYLNNARQVPMLPDWAVVDLRTPPDSVHPGKIAAADFFDEHWALKPPRTGQ